MKFVVEIDLDHLPSSFEVASQLLAISQYVMRSADSNGRPVSDLRKPDYEDNSLFCGGAYADEAFETLLCTYKVVDEPFTDTLPHYVLRAQGKIELANGEVIKDGTVNIGKPQ